MMRPMSAPLDWLPHAWALKRVVAGWVAGRSETHLPLMSCNRPQGARRQSQAVHR